MTTCVGICMEKKVVMFETLTPTVCIKKLTAANEQSKKLYACQDEEEVHSDNQVVGHDLSEDDLIQIGDNYVHVADQLEEMVRDAMGYDGCTILEFEKLKRMVTNMKTPL